MLLLKYKKLRKLFDGEESVIIYEGRLNIKEMKKQRYNMDDLITQIREVVTKGERVFHDQGGEG